MLRAWLQTVLPVLRMLLPDPKTKAGLLGVACTLTLYPRRGGLYLLQKCVLALAADGAGDFTLPRRCCMRSMYQAAALQFSGLYILGISLSTLAPAPAFVLDVSVSLNVSNPTYLSASAISAKADVILVAPPSSLVKASTHTARPRNH